VTLEVEIWRETARVQSPTEPEDSDWVSETLWRAARPDDLKHPALGWFIRRGSSTPSLLRRLIESEL